ncbi:hypothetical protein FACS18942_09660 [Planctomycetales bacterium]|nr:hypothetical protein FACS18942_09660 [Planctomycetales bacterium]
MVTVADFHKAFLEAEEDIKFAELSIGSLASIENSDCEPACEPRGVVVPSINELRYAAKHISSAVQNGVLQDKQEEEIRRAIRHCIRARLDALKSVILFFARDFYKFTDDYRLLDIDDADRKNLNEHRQKIHNVMLALSKNHSESTNEDCEKLKSSIEELQVVYIDVLKYRGIFNKVLSKIDAHDKSTTWQWKAGIVFAIILSLIAMFWSSCCTLPASNTDIPSFLSDVPCR